ncbi:tetratricopeptide repeat protein [Brevundimonas sp.]|uniref:tetratricopeptide repeat protein n=1 Tax=Brevundimonas sp. TaxID=1871086 RepID=UPI0025D21E51|nr:tetratricopeptide repeat protein [Brevundimonas sp.]
MSDVFEEVEENLRAEKWNALFRRWWPVAAAVAGVLLLIALGFWFFDARKGWTGAEASEAYARGMEALQSENEAAAEAAFVEVEAAGNAPYRALALMQRAGLRINQGETEEAIALFDQAAEATGEPMIADIAGLKAAWLLMDTASLEDITARLEPLTGDDRPFRYQAREALALARLQHGQADTARSGFQALTLDLETPESLRQRAQAALNMIESGVAASLPGIVEAAARAAEAAETEAQRPGAPAQGGQAPGAPATPPAGQ